MKIDDKLDAVEEESNVKQKEYIANVIKHSKEGIETLKIAENANKLMVSDDKTQLIGEKYTSD